MSVPGLPDAVGDATVPIDWRCMDCRREWRTTAVADVCCPDCGAEGAWAVLEKTIRGPSA